MNTNSPNDVGDINNDLQQNAVPAENVVVTPAVVQTELAASDVPAVKDKAR